MREDVPWDIYSLVQGQSLLIEAQVADLLLDFVRLTLRQRDVLLQNVQVAEKDIEALRELPLFERKLFPVDFDALELRLNTERTRVQKLAMYTELARKSAATPVVANPPSAKQTVLSRLSEEEGAANNSLGDMLCNPEEVVGIAVAEAEVLAIHHLLTLRDVITLLSS